MDDDVAASQPRRSAWQRGVDAGETAVVSAVVAYGLPCVAVGATSAFVSWPEWAVLTVTLWVAPGAALLAGVLGAVMGAFRPRRILRWPWLLGIIFGVAVTTEVALEIFTISSNPEERLGVLVYAATFAFILGTSSVGVLSAAGVNSLLARRGPRAVKVSRIVMVSLALAAIAAVAAYLYLVTP